MNKLIQIRCGKPGPPGPPKSVGISARGARMTTPHRINQPGNLVDEDIKVITHKRRRNIDKIKH